MVNVVISICLNLDIIQYMRDDNFQLMRTRESMKKIVSADSRNRLMSAIMLLVIIPLWMMGWILSCIGSLQPKSKKQLQKKQILHKIPNNSKQIPVESRY